MPGELAITLSEPLNMEESEILALGSSTLIEVLNEMVGFVEEAENAPPEVVRELTIIRLALLQLARIELIRASKEAGMDVLDLLTSAEKMTTQTLKPVSPIRVKA